MISMRVAADVGGTFDGHLRARREEWRRPSGEGALHAGPDGGVLTGIDEAGIDLSEVVLFSHSTTITTNALITRRFPPAGMVTTAGFRDIIEIRGGTQKDDLWDPTGMSRPLHPPS